MLIAFHLLVHTWLHRLSLWNQRLRNNLRNALQWTDGLWQKLHYCIVGTSSSGALCENCIHYCFGIIISLSVDYQNVICQWLNSCRISVRMFLLYSFEQHVCLPLFTVQTGIHVSCQFSALLNWLKVRRRKEPSFLHSTGILFYGKEMVAGFWQPNSTTFFLKICLITAILVH